MARNFARSSNGIRSFSASSRTRWLNASQLSSRSENRSAGRSPAAAMSYGGSTSYSRLWDASKSPATSTSIPSFGERQVAGRMLVSVAEVTPGRRLLLASHLVNPRLDSLLRGAVTAVQANALTPLYALPTAVRRRLAGTPIQIDGNTLDPEIQLLLRLESLLPSTTKSEVATARNHLRNICKLVSGRPADLDRVTDLTVQGAAGHLAARLYIPRDT